MIGDAEESAAVTVIVVPNSKCTMQSLLADLITNNGPQALNVLVIRAHAY